MSQSDGLLWDNIMLICKKCGICQLSDIAQLFINVINLFTMTIAGLGLFFFFAGGFFVFISRGDSGYVTKGKDMMIQTLIAIAITLTSWIIVSFVVFAVTGGGTKIFNYDWFQFSFNEPTSTVDTQK